MPSIPGLKVLFVAGFGPIVREPARSKKLYVDDLGLPLEAMEGDPTYFHGEKLDGVTYFDRNYVHARDAMSQPIPSCNG